ncbi:MAG: RdgB/HAM1 family non-canonical purine NTP pyrophosphatase [Erysipelotrichales bacterium]|nr:MAG: RdgB/HAM1 family non-canonical purine NTP pyrophosphatase [Erysipelotrichales bacterium]
MKLLIATHNENKKIEILHFLQQIGGYEVVTLRDLGIEEEPEETGTTFRENALLKANWAMGKTGLLTIADDSGLEIDAFNKEPGVYSARYLGKDTPYPEKNEIILQRLTNETRRNARFVCAMAIVSPDLRPVVMEGRIEGNIGMRSQGRNGFGYDPIFYPLGSKRSLAEYELDEKNEVSHRAIALMHTVRYLEGLKGRDEK